MHKLLQKWMLALSLLMLGSLNSAYALTSTGTDGAFTLNNALTLNASNNQTFNFTTFDLGTGGTLDFSGLTSQDSIFILATGDIHLDGILNLSSNLMFETAGSIFVSGTINIGTNAFSLVAGTNINFASPNSNDDNSNLIPRPIAIVLDNDPTNLGWISFDINDANSELINFGYINVGKPTLVPEPSTYALILAGTSLLILRRNKFSITRT